MGKMLKQYELWADVFWEVSSMDMLIDDALGQYSQCSNKSETCVVKTQQPISVSNSHLLPGIGFPRHDAHESPSL